MLNQINFPPGEALIYIYEHPNSISDGSPLREKLVNLVELLIFKSKNKGVSLAIQSLIEESFEVRMLMVSHLLGHPSEMNEMQERILSEITTQSYSQDKGNLSKIYCDTLSIYYQILAPHAEKLSQSEAKTLDLTQYNYRIFKQLILSNSASPYSDVILNQLDFGMYYDLASILGHLVLENKLELDPSEVNLLSQIIRNCFEGFGACAIKLELWEPEPEDASYLVMNILDIVEQPLPPSAIFRNEWPTEFEDVQSQIKKGLTEVAKIRSGEIKPQSLNDLLYGE